MKHRFPLARPVLAVLVLVLLTNCTVGATRISFGLTTLADAGTTQAGLSRGYAEGNPVLKSAPVPIMLVLSAAIALVAEHAIRAGDEKTGKTVYRVAAVIHGLAAAWNFTQLAKADSAPAAAGARP